MIIGTENNTFQWLSIYSEINQEDSTPKNTLYTRYMQGVQLFPPVTQNFKILEIHKLEKRLHKFRFGSRIFSLNTSYYMM